MSNFIDAFIKQNEKISTFLVEIATDPRNADSKIESIKHFSTASHYNAALGVLLACSLQLLNKEENFSDFQLTDIRCLFDSLMKIEEQNLEIFIEAGYFEWSVMDDREKALLIIHQGITRATEKLAELKKLLSEIEQDS